MKIGKMLLNVGLPLCALAGALVSADLVHQGRAPIVSQPPLVAPSANPYAKAVSGAGIIEAQSQNIAVAPAIGGIVTEVFVQWGQHVEAGAKLYQIDDRPLAAQLAAQQADINARQAALAQALATLAKLQAGARPEDVPIYQARVQAAEATLADNQDQYQRVLKLGGTGAVSADDLNRRRFAVAETQAVLAEARADLAKLQAGTWQRDIAIQETTVAMARVDIKLATAKLATLQLDRDRLTVCAPVGGSVLRINVRKGEFVAAAGVGNASDASVVIGDIDHLHVRVDIDENDVPRFGNGAPATGFIRGRTNTPIPLEFVRVEPFVIPKKNLTGASLERVDTRVLQVIYALPKTDMPLYVGQQLDVFINAAAAPPPG